MRPARSARRRRVRLEARPRSSTCGSSAGNSTCVSASSKSTCKRSVGRKRRRSLRFSCSPAAAGSPASACWRRFGPTAPTAAQSRTSTRCGASSSGGLDYEGTCPYLLRDQGGVRLDARLLRSDVAELDSICRALSFGEIDLDRWRDHLEAIDGSYSGDLLPSESVNDDIAAARRRLRINLVDSLVCASGRLWSQAVPRGAVVRARGGRPRPLSRGCVRRAHGGAARCRPARRRNRHLPLVPKVSCRRARHRPVAVDRRLIPQRGRGRGGARVVDSRYFPITASFLSENHSIWSCSGFPRSMQALC